MLLATASRLGLGQQGLRPVQRVMMTLKGRVPLQVPAVKATSVRLNSGQLFLVCQVAEAQEEEFRRALLSWTQWQAAPMETFSDLHRL